MEQVFKLRVKESNTIIPASPDHARMEYNLAIGSNTDSWRMSLLAGFNKFAHLNLQIYENQNLLKRKNLPPDLTVPHVEGLTKVTNIFNVFLFTDA